MEFIMSSSYRFTTAERSRLSAVAATRLKHESADALRRALVGVSAEIAFGLITIPPAMHERVWRGAIMSRTTACHYRNGSDIIRVQGTIRPQGLTEPSHRGQATIYVLGQVREDISEVVFIGWTRRSELELVPSRRIPSQMVLHAALEDLHWMDELTEGVLRHGVTELYAEESTPAWDCARPQYGGSRFKGIG